MKRLLLCLSFLSLFAFCETPAPFIFDQNFSPTAAGQDFLIVQNELIRLENRYAGKLFDRKDFIYQSDLNSFIAPSKFETTTLKERLLGRTVRFAELSLLWNPINYLVTTTQHEVFGHGYRVRDLGLKKAKVLSYKIGVPIPYGKGGGMTYYRPTKNYTLQDDLLVSIAGNEANTILAHQTAMSWLSRNKIDGREANLYSFCSNSLFNYIVNLKNAKQAFDCIKKGKGHDIAIYLMRLNLLYPSDKTFESQLEDLHLKAILSGVADTFSWISAYATIKYIWSGNPVTPSRSDRFLRFLVPTYRVSLTPFGPDDTFGAYALFKNSEPFYLYYKTGKFSQNRYNGFGIENQGLFKIGRSQFGLKLDFWTQPLLNLQAKDNHDVEAFLITRENFWALNDKDSKYEYDIDFDHTLSAYSDEELYSSKFGGAGSLIYQYQFAGSRSNTLFAQLGYKTRGFLPGETIHAAPIVKFGLNVLF